MAVNDRGAQNFLNRLHWDAVMNKDANIVRFVNDTYEFRFAEPLEGKILIAFTAFLKSLPMTEIRSILKIWMWLYQHDISFQMKFTWNKNRSMLYNLRRIYEPRRINKRLNRFRCEDLMAYSFED